MSPAAVQAHRGRRGLVAVALVVVIVRWLIIAIQDAELVVDRLLGTRPGPC
jgi:F0F1-type ATP synthase assembly protein I